MNAHYFTVSAGNVIAHCCVSEHKYIVYKKNKMYMKMKNLQKNGLVRKKGKVQTIYHL